MRTILVLFAAFLAFTAFYLTLDCVRYGEYWYQYALIVALDVLAAFGISEAFGLIVRDIVRETDAI